MRVPVTLVLLAACGRSTESPRDTGTATPDDQVTPVDEGTPDAPPAPVLPPCADPVSGTTIVARRVGPALGDVAVLVTAPIGDPRLFVVMRGGAIHILDDGALLPEPFIDLQDRLSSGGELGLLGLAFHPSYHINHQFFVYYTRLADPPETVHRFRDVVARCTASDAAHADLASCEEILEIKDPASNHNGGMIEFGPDGYLYIGTGDGGTANDPSGNGQTVVDGVPVAKSIALLGKMLRIDVDHEDAGKRYAIPSGNPFAAGGGALEILALGLRNPWRWSFDRETNDVWIGDVGQDAVEEINVSSLAELPGKNFGWSMWEGNDCAKPPCTTDQKSFPQRAHRHGGAAPDNFSAVIGGQVYRGTCYPDIVGTYFYTDNGTGKLYTATLQPDGSLVTTTLPANYPAGATSIHAAATGELFMTLENGSVFHLEARP